MTGGPDTLRPGEGVDIHEPTQAELGTFASIMRTVVQEVVRAETPQIVREETASIRSTLAHLSDQMQRDRAENVAHRVETAERFERHEQRFDSLEHSARRRSRPWVGAVTIALIALTIALVTAGVAIGNTLLLRTIAQMLQIQN